METVSEARERLWAEGYLVAIVGLWNAQWNCPVKLAYSDVNGKVFRSKELQDRELAVIHPAGDGTFGVAEIQFFHPTKATPEEIEAHYQSLLPSAT
jgi:hypothetical protein